MQGRQNMGTNKHGKREDKAKEVAEQSSKCEKYQGLPGMKSHVRPFVIAPDCQEEDGWNRREICSGANGIV